MKKLLIITLLLFSVSCSYPVSSYGLFSKFQAESNSNTEIYCPNSGQKILILYATRADVSKSIIDAVKEKKRTGENNRYTTLHFSGRGTSIYNTTPEELLNECLLLEMARNPNVPLKR
ncbi:MAG: hypothetical protein ACJA0S_001198 [Rickettsiales bacterium]|jgi:hypothetical protein